MRLFDVLLVVGLFFIVLALLSPLSTTLTRSFDAVIDSIAPLFTIQIPVTKIEKVNNTLREQQDIVTVDLSPVFKALARILVLLLPIIVFLLLTRRIEL